LSANRRVGFFGRGRSAPEAAISAAPTYVGIVFAIADSNLQVCSSSVVNLKFIEEQM
jgi:hypothetical protein